MDEFEQNIRGLTDEDLIQMVKVDFADYVDEALAIARDELKHRDFQEEQYEPKEAAKYEAEQPDKTEQLRRLLGDDPKYQESYESLIGFVTSMNIRNGEYQGDYAVIRKMDFENSILFTEVTGENNSKIISECVAAGKAELVALIDEIAGENGVLREAEE